MDQVWCKKVMQAFFSGFFAADKRARAQEKEEDEEEDDIEDTVESRLEKRLIIYNSMKDRIRSLGLAFSKGAEPITIYNYLALWIILGVGYSMAWFAFFGERTAKLKWFKIVCIRNAVLKQKENWAYILFPSMTILTVYSDNQLTDFAKLKIFSKP